MIFCRIFLIVIFLIERYFNEIKKEGLKNKNVNEFKKVVVLIVIVILVVLCGVLIIGIFFNKKRREKKGKLMF